MANIEIKIEVEIPGIGHYSTHAVWPVDNLPKGHTHVDLAATEIHKFAEKIDKLEGK